MSASVVHGNRGVAMARGVFLHKADSIYDDQPAERYQFPSMYLDRAFPLIGDWVVYKEPGKSGLRGYFAVAKVEQIVPDPSAPGRYLALIEPGSYLDFERAVPFRTAEGRVERDVPNAQWAVRPLSNADFNRILALGFPEEEPLLPRVDADLEISVVQAVTETHAPYVVDVARDRIAYLGSRIVRDRIFRKRVLAAYDCRCAITGLKLINGGGRAEVEAAHIKPVEAHGPDIITNGIALSGTAHWMFDRGLISLSDDLDVLVSRQVNDVESVWALINKSRRANAPANQHYRPHPQYLGWHRENCFKH
jgi:putative restriction endonuclease